MAAASPTLHHQVVESYVQTTRDIRDQLVAASAVAGDGSARAGNNNVCTLAKLLRLSAQVLELPTFADLATRPNGVHSLSEYLEPMLQLRVPHHTAALISAMLDCNDRLPQAERLHVHRALLPARMQLMSDFLTQLRKPLRCLAALREAAFYPPPPSAYSAAPATLYCLQSRLLDQLTEVEVTNAVARVCFLVQRDVWLSSAAAGASATSSPQHRTATLAGAILDACGQLRDVVAVMGISLLFFSGRVVSGLLMDAAHLPTELPVAVGSPAVSRETHLRHVLAALTQSNVLAALCAALLAAPPLPRGCHAGQYDFMLADVQGGLVFGMQTLFSISKDLDEVEGMIAILESTHLRKWLQELLRQLAAVADLSPSSAPAAAAAAAASAVVQPVPCIWPMFQAPPPESNSPEYGAAIFVWALKLRVSELVAFGFIQRLDMQNSGAAATRLAEELLPSRREAAALGVGVMRTVHGCLGRLLRVWASDPTLRAQAVPSCTSGTPENFLSDFLLPVLVLLFRMGDAPPEEAQDCLPDLLEMIAWSLAMCAAMTSTPTVKLDPAMPWLMSMSLTGLLHGMVYELPLPGSIEGIPSPGPAAVPCLSVSHADAWQTLAPDARAACLERLGLADLPRSLDVLLRFSVSRGSWQEQALQQQPDWEQGAEPELVLSAAVAELVTPLICARLRRVRRSQQKGRPDGGGDAGDVSGDGTAISGPSAARQVQREVQGDELGLVITALKLLRREAALRVWDSGRPRRQRPQSDDARWRLASFVSEAGLSNRGLPLLLRELLAVPGSSGGDDHARVTRFKAPAGVDVTALVVAQAVAACGEAVLPYMRQLVEEAIADVPRVDEAGGGSDGLPSPREVLALNLADQGRAAARAVKAAAVHLPPEVLLAAAPQQLMAAVGRLLSLLSEESSRGLWLPDTSVMVADRVRATISDICDAVVLLSADGRLREGCVRGWLWAEEAAPDASPSAPRLDLPALSALYQEAPRDATAPAQLRGPVVTLALRRDLASAGFDCSWSWVSEHERRDGEVVALASAFVQDRRWGQGSAWGLLSAAAEAAAEATDAEGPGCVSEEGLDGRGGGKWEAKMWPPQLLRYCGNPLCSDYSGRSEADLNLRSCGGCLVVRYCSPACQARHWRQHKVQCAQWSAGRSQ